MAVISLKWFGGMIPRAGEQHLPPPHATEAENCSLYSGELRPLKKPALAHRFWSPTEADIFPPIIGPACIQYACDAYDAAIRASVPAVYYPMTGGLSETNAVSNPVPLGTEFYDQMGTNDPMVLTSSNSLSAFNVLGTPLYPDRCPGQGTSFTQDSLGADGWNLPLHGIVATGQGTVSVDFAIFGFTSGGGELIQLEWSTNNGGSPVPSRLEIITGNLANSVHVNVHTR
jgi:hypothetical protein